MKTPYGDYNVGDVFEPADGSNYTVVVMDVDSFADVEDITIQGPNGVPHRIDWFKMSYKYKRVGEAAKPRTRKEK